jgi:DNA-binding beta-propeller fold protein YncE
MYKISQAVLWPLLCGANAFAALLLTAVIVSSAAANSLIAPQAVIRIAGAQHGIGFDDIGYFPSLKRVSIPAGQTGKLLLLDPANRAITNTYQVTVPVVGAHEHASGTTSAAYVDGYIFASDHGQPGVVVLDARNGKVLQSIRLSSGPDYVRYLESRHELWVTEPRGQQIQVFSIDNSGSKPVITLNSNIPVAGGPESLVFDPLLKRAYTNLWKQKTVVIDTTTHKQTDEWNNTCEGPRGLAIDAGKGFLFVACTEGKVAVLDAKDGKLLATAKSGAGIDIISYNLKSGHLYVPGASSATMTAFKVSPSGSLHAVRIYRTAKGAHCVTDDGGARVFVCDPHAGTILEFRDP